MITQYLTVGDPIAFRGKTGELDYYSNDIAVIKFFDGTSMSISHTSLAKAQAEGEVSIIRRNAYNPCFIHLDNDQEQEVVRFEKYCTALDDKIQPCAKGAREDVIKKISVELGDLSPPSISHLHKIYRKWVLSGKNMVHVLFGYQRQRRPVIPDELFNLMDKVIDEEYLKPTKPTIYKAYEEFVKAYRDKQYIAPCPSLSSFERRLKKGDRLAFIKRRYGASAAREEGRTATSKTILRRILDLVSMDAAHFNLGLKNIYGKYVGMPTIYFVMDDYSRVILGYGIHVGKHSESSACVIHALRYAISKKLDPLYPYYGLPSNVVVDQGVAYVSEDSVRYLEGLQVHITKTATRMGWGKPMLERFIGTSRTRFFSGFDGYLGKREKGTYSDQTAKNSAVHTVAEFRQAFSEFIIEYHNTPHAGLYGKTPAQVWAKSAESNPPITLEDIPYSQLLRGIREEKILKHVTGITYLYQNFNSEELQQLYHSLQPSKGLKRRSQVKVTIYLDPLDASAISVVNPLTNKLFEVPNIIGEGSIGLTFAELHSGRKAQTTAEAAPIKDGGICEGYNSKQRRKGSDVPLDDFDNPIDLELILKTPSKPIVAPKTGYESRSQKDEDDNYVVTVD